MSEKFRYIEALPYRYRSDKALAWRFCNFMEGEATVRVALVYDTGKRKFSASRGERRQATDPWGSIDMLPDHEVEAYVNRLLPEDIARCFAASLAAQSTGDDDAA